MSADRLETVGIAAPPGFPTSAHNAVHQSMVHFKDSNAESWRLFGAGWKGVVYRYRGAHESSCTYTSIATLERPPTFEERFSQDHALYEFYGSSLSALECYFFSLYCISAVIDPDTFPLSSANDLRFQPSTVRDKLKSSFPIEPLTTKVIGYLSAPEFRSLSDMRNVLAHRGVLPRYFKVGGAEGGKSHIPGNPKDLSSDWAYSLEIAASTTGDPMAWMQKAICDLVEATQAFCDAKL